MPTLHACIHAFHQGLSTWLLVMAACMCMCTGAIMHASTYIHPGLVTKLRCMRTAGMRCVLNSPRG
eukprot:261830-Chlamydomonas_euryale.AAC.2